MKITPAMCRNAYELLRLTEPFKSWKLPSSRKVRFTTKPTWCIADYNPPWKRGGHRINVCPDHNGHLSTIMISMAHEMCHLAQWVAKQPLDHGRSFQSRARAVCKQQGFDAKIF